MGSFRRVSFVPFGLCLCLLFNQKKKEVCVPLHINLKKDQYTILKVDTLITETMIYKKIIYEKKRNE